MANRYEAYTIPQLRNMLEDKGYRTIIGVRTRADLINLLQEHDNKRPNIANPAFINQPNVPLQPITRKIEPVLAIQKMQLSPIFHMPIPSTGQILLGNTAELDNKPPYSPYRVRNFINTNKSFTRYGDYPFFNPLPYPSKIVFFLRWGEPITKRMLRSNIEIDGNIEIDPVGYCMLVDINTNMVSNLLTELGFSNLIVTEDVCYNLLWYIHVAKVDINILSNEDKAALSNMKDENLLTFLGPLYTGPRDTAALLFAAITGQSVYKPAIDNLPRYQKVKEYPAANAWYIAQLLYNITDKDNKIISPYGPYVHIAIQKANIIEEIMARVRHNNVEAFMTRYGMISNINDLRRHNVNLFDYFMHMIASYETVVTRGNYVPPIPDTDITLITNDDAIKLLAPYTVDELINFYEPIGTWTSRNKLIKIIRKNYVVDLLWTFRNRHCNNDDMINVIEGVHRRAIDKNNYDDLTLSYGVRGNYMCYQASELSASFRYDDNGIFQFYNPDWIPNTTQVVNRVFDIKSIKMLYKLLSDAGGISLPIKVLKEKISIGIAQSYDTNKLLAKLRNEYEEMPITQRKLVKLYLAWLFYYGMWLRFWKGPGNIWPLEWIAHENENRCGLVVRDSQTVIQQGVGNRIMVDAVNYPELTAWLNNLPLVDYNFRTKEARMATKNITTIKEILDPISKGMFCLADGSDKILRDAYFLITSILQIASDIELYDFLTIMLPVLYQYELNVVLWRLANRANEQPNDLKVLLERKQVLESPIPILAPLVINQIENTAHTDPNFIELIAFD